MSKSRKFGQKRLKKTKFGLKSLKKAEKRPKNREKTDKILPEGKLLSCGATFSSWGATLWEKGPTCQIFQIVNKKTLISILDIDLKRLEIMSRPSQKKDKKFFPEQPEALESVSSP